MTEQEHDTQTFGLFYRISPDVIRRDLAGVLNNFAEINQLVADFRLLPRYEQTPEKVARFLHNQMVWAYGHCLIPQIPQPVACNWIAAGVTDVANLAVKIESAKAGSLGVLMRELNRIMREAGVEDDDWGDREQPTEYGLLSAQASEEIKSIDDTIILMVLRKYLLDDLADQYENDRASYDENVSEGGRLLSERLQAKLRSRE